MSKLIGAQAEGLLVVTVVTVELLSVMVIFDGVFSFFSFCLCVYSRKILVD